TLDIHRYGVEAPRLWRELFLDPVANSQVFLEDIPLMRRLNPVLAEGRIVFKRDWEAGEAFLNHSGIPPCQGLSHRVADMPDLGCLPWHLFQARLDILPFASQLGQSLFTGALEVSPHCSERLESGSKVQDLLGVDRLHPAEITGTILLCNDSVNHSLLDLGFC